MDPYLPYLRKTWRKKCGGSSTLRDAIICLRPAPAGDNVSKVLVFSTDGYLLMPWNSTTLEMPHGVFLANAASSNPTVWITDVGNGPYGHCIKQYTPSGKLLQVITFTYSFVSLMLFHYILEYIINI